MTRLGHVLAVVAVVPFAAVGCGPRTGEVHGTVSFAGKPVDRGRIILMRQQADTRVHQAAVMSGTFELVVPVGEYRVELFALHDDDALAADPSLPMQYIPPKYNAESTLTLEVHSGPARDVSFDLVK